MTCPDVMDLERYVLRELDEPASSSVAAHLTTCAWCAREIGELTRNLELVSALRRDPLRSSDQEDQRPFFDETPESIGPYRILGKLGQGGMGTVYEAQQENPARVVAVKVIRPGLVSASLHARFRHEAQILGRLRHPGIAQIFEAGTHRGPSGPQSYLVMERVNGATLIRYADSKSLTMRQRLELLADIGDAVQHAHQRGVIHRDLKPDNILIDDTSGKPQPKILDFGVARVVDPDGQSTTLQTNVGQIVGTIAYMSPEQASADPADIDTRADVYALGVICYELLSRRLPYRLNAASVAESVRVIVQDEPTPLATVDRQLRGDVSTIVAKALEKDKSRRYQTAAEMAEDIRRHLRDEPITAHRPSTIYQLRKFARRNKGVVAGVIAAFVLLILGVIGTSIGLVRANRARSSADRSAAIARKEAAKQTAVTDFVKEMLGSASSRNLTAGDRAKGRNVTVLEALNEAGRKVDSGVFKDQPDIELAIRDTIGLTYLELGEYEPAARHYEAALALARSRPDTDAGDVGRALHGMALIRHSQGQFAQAEEYTRQTIEIARSRWGDQSEDVASATNDLAMMLQAQGRFTEAEALLRRALEVRRKLFGDERAEVALVMSNLSIVLSSMARLPEAELLARESLRIRRKVLGAEHPYVSESTSQLAGVLESQGKIDEAEHLYRESLAMRRRLLGDEHPNVAVVMCNLAWLLQNKGQFDEAESLYKQSIEIERKASGEENPTYVAYLNHLGTLLFNRGKFADAEAVFRQTLAARRKLLGNDHPAVATSLHNVGFALGRQKHWTEAETMFREALSISTKRYGEDHPATAGEHLQLGNALIELRRFDEAERELLAAFRVLEPRLPIADRDAVANVVYLTKLYRAWAKPDEAARWRARIPSTRPATTES